MNRPVNFNDPTGHMLLGPCGSHGEECGAITSTSDDPVDPIIITNPYDDDDDNDVSRLKDNVVSNILTGIPSEQAVCEFFLSGAQDACNMDTWNSFISSDDPLSIYSLINTIPYIRYDIWRVDANNLAWDYVGLILSITGIKSVQNGLAVASGIKPIKTAIGLINSTVWGTTFTHYGYSFYYLVSAPKMDTIGLAITTVSIYPPAAVGASSASIIRDLSAGFYDVRETQTLLSGPPAGPYCNGRYGC